MHSFLRSRSLAPRLLNLLLATRPPLASLLLVSLLLAAPAQGAIVFNNGAPDGASGNDATFWQQADPFALSTPANLTGAAVYLAGFGDLSNWDGTIEYFIYSDLGGSPDLPLASGFGTSITLVAGFPWDFGGDSVRASFQFTAPFSAAAFTSYWFAIHFAADYDNTDSVFWVTTAPTSGAGRELAGGVGVWVGNGQKHAFYLTDSSRPSSSVPEPKSLALWGLGVLAVATLVGRRWLVAPR